MTAAKHAILCLPLLALTTSTCDNTTGPDLRPIASIVVSPDSVSMHVGHSLQMSAVVRDATGDTLSGRTVSWTSSDTTRVAVSATGLATARSYGAVTIAATADTVSGTAALRVLVPVTRIDVSPAATLVPGGSIQLTATLTGADGSVLSDRAITWESTTPAVATVGAASIATAGQVGTTSITASSEGVTSTATTITVTQPSFVRLGSGEAARHTCGVTAAGTAYCWGDNIAGALGNGTFTDSGLTGGLGFPTGVSGLALATTIGGGAGFTCAVAGSPLRVFCWGAGDEYKLGSGPPEHRAFPFPVSGGRAARDVAVGHEHSCLLTTDTLTFCWGNGLQDPTLVPGGLKFATIVSGHGVSCGLAADSIGYCWPVGLGVGNPLPVPGGLKLVALTLGFQHRCGIAADSVAYCWGQNSDGQLGDGTTTFRTSPVPVSGGWKWAAIAAGGEFTCGITGGSAYCWGANNVGQLGGTVGTGSLAPAPVAGGLVFAQITAGELHACGLTTAGVAYCWGWNAYGQVGDGTKSDRSTPIRVAGQP